MALGDLIVSVRANADQFSSDMKKVQQSATSTTDRIVAGWGKTEKAAADAITKMERRAQSKVITREFTAQTDAIIKGFGKTSAAADTAGRRTSESFRNAGAALNQIEQMVGIQLPAALDKFLIQSKTVGPILNAAFSGVAILGTIQLLGQLPALFDRIAAAMTGWDEKAQQVYKNMTAANKKLADELGGIAFQMRELALGPTGALAEAVSKQRAVVIDLGDQLKKSEESQRAFRSRLIGPVQKFPERFGALSEALGMPHIPTDAELDAARTRLQEESAKLTTLQAKLDLERSQDAKTAADKAAADEDRRADERFRARLMRIDRESKALNEAIQKASRSVSATGFGVSPGLLDVLNPLEARPPDITPLLKQVQETIDKSNELSLKGAEIRADGEIAASKMASDRILDDQLRMLARIEDSAGAVFDAIFQKGESVFQSLASLGTSLAQTFARTLFQDLAGMGASALLGGKGGAGGTLAGQLPGMAGLLGLGKGFAFSGAKFASIVPGAPGFTLGATGGGAGLGTAIGALATNPITIAAAAALIGGTAWAKSQAHHEANTFVQKFQNPLGRAMDSIVNSSKTAADKLASINSLWEDFEANAQQFAAAGSDEAKVVQQAFETLQPLVDRIRGDLRGLAGSGGPATIMLQLDKRTVARLIIPDLYALTRNEGMQLQPTPTR